MNSGIRFLYGFILLFALLSYHLLLHSQEITGSIYDAISQTPLENVNIKILDTRQGATSDKNGNFSVSLTQGGIYNIQISRLGYQLLQKEINLLNDTILHLVLYLFPQSIKLEKEIVVTARRTETDWFDTPEAISVVKEEALFQEAPRSTPEAISGTTGVFLQKTNHGGGSPIIRGLIGNQNLLLIDGIRLNNATFRYGPNQYFNTIDPFMVERIEVLRGSGSVLYGSDALGGVVHVITQDASFSDSSLSINGNINGKMMSKDMEKTSRASLSISDKRIAFTGGITYNDFGHIYAGQGIGEENPTGYKNLSTDAKLRIKLNERNFLTMAWQYNRQDDVPRYDRIASGTFQKFHFDPQIRKLGYVRFSTELNSRLVDNINITAFGGESYENRLLQRTGESIITNELDIVNTYGGIINIKSSISENWMVVSGIDYYYDKVLSKKKNIDDQGNTSTSRGYYPDGAVASSIALFSSHTLSTSLFDFVLGGRYNIHQIKADDPKFENIRLYPTALVANASIVVRVLENHRIVGNVYSAFRAPNINDLSSYGSFNYGIEVPNTKLDPERSLTAEIGLKSQHQRFSASLFLYNSRLSDLIVRVPTQWNGQDSIDGEKVFHKTNYAKAFIRGLEAEMQYHFNARISIYGNMTFTYGQNRITNQPMTRIPPLNGKLGLFYNHSESWWSRLEWHAAAKQKRLSPGDIRDTRIPEGGTPKWNIFNIRTGFKWNFLNTSAGLNNLFNKAYRTHGSGVHSYGRSFWINVSVAF